MKVTLCLLKNQKGFGLLSLDRILVPLSRSCPHQCHAPQVHASCWASEVLYGTGSWGDLSLLALELNGPLPYMMSQRGCTEPADRVDTQSASAMW